MQLEHTLPYETPEGNKYLIEFSSFAADSLPINIKVPVVNLNLVQVGFVKQNSSTFFKYVAQYVCDYINFFDVILYYYCDQSEVYIRKARNLKPQQYRSKLFNHLYNSIENYTLIKHDVFISDPINGDHYFTMITSVKNSDALDELIPTIENLRK